ncbi:CREB-regulated transcription coactivator 1 [Nymphon striatum]|nr:CREB-regulated transcription coactivator 1 [Nymphon striatum]
MSNPRKFSEKIALHNQKQAEETAAFEKIMREVSETRAPIVLHQPPYPNQHLYINPPLGAYRGGSLPNVNQIGNNAIDLQNALENLESMKQGNDCLTDRIQRDRSRHISHRSRTPHYEKRRDASPYESNYLSLPPDTSWRRTNSDSALHQSATTPLENSPLGSINNLYLSSPCANSPNIQHRYSPNNFDNTLLSDKNYWDNKLNFQSPNSPHRPKSCEVPGINIYPSQEDGSASPGSTTPHIPISNSTGSLPDLTNLHFPSPLATPLDSEDQMCYSTGDPSQSGQTTLPPSSILSHNSHHNRQRCDSGIGILSSQNSSPTIQNGVHHIPSDQLQQQSTNATSVRSSLHRENSPRLSNLIIQNSKTSQDTSNVSSQYSQQPQTLLSQYGMYQSELMTPAGGTQVITESYRGRSASPGDNSSCSAPTSPVSPSSSPGLDSMSYTKNSSQHSTYFLQQQQQTNALQHQFEHFNMAQDQIPTSTAINNLYLGGNGSPNSNAIVTISENSSENNIYFVSSQLAAAPHSPLSPNPPPYSNSVINRITQPVTSLPEIILTVPKFLAPASDEALRQDFVKDLGNAMASMSGSFDSDLFGSTDEALRAGLGPIDFDGLQMLTDPDIPIDPATEETFRNDRL